MARGPCHLPRLGGFVIFIGETTMTLLRSIAPSAAFALSALVLSLAGPAQAQGTAQERSACMGDAFRFCSGDIPNVPKIEACLKSKVNQLSPACRAEFEPSGKSKMHRSHFN
jgi:hypothetical protein